MALRTKILVNIHPGGVFSLSDAVTVAMKETHPGHIWHSNFSTIRDDPLLIGVVNDLSLGGIQINGSSEADICIACISSEYASTGPGEDVYWSLETSHVLGECVSYLDDKLRADRMETLLRAVATVAFSHTGAQPIRQRIRELLQEYRPNVLGEDSDYE